jgi:GTP cyclohydrolase I
MNPKEGVVELLKFIGEDPDREGLKDTPSRVVQAFIEMTRGYDHQASDILATVFDDPCDEMVMVTGIKFVSLCEHHLLPFTGIAAVAYIPKGKVVGLSKIPRLVEMFSKRLQMQERLTTQIADAMDEHLHPQGVGVIMKARHACMALRGVEQDTGEMVTSALRGDMRNEPETRAEFLALARSMNGVQ